MTFSSRPGLDPLRRVRDAAPRAPARSAAGVTNGSASARRGIDRPSNSPGVVDAPTSQRRRRGHVQRAVAFERRRRPRRGVHVTCEPSTPPASASRAEAKPLSSARSREDELDRVQCDVAPLRVLGHRPGGAQVRPREQRLVAQHLLEVRDVPLGVDAVAREATAQVVVESRDATWRPASVRPRSARVDRRTPTGPRRNSGAGTSARRRILRRRRSGRRGRRAVARATPRGPASRRRAPGGR